MPRADANAAQLMYRARPMFRRLIERHIFARLARTYLAVLGVLAGMVWLVQAARLIDDVLGKSGDLLAFASLSALTLPYVLSLILAPALFIAALVCFIQLLQDNEYFALKAAGYDPRNLLRPVLTLCALVMLAQAALSFFAAPHSLRQLRLERYNVAAEAALDILKPGVFRDVATGITAFAAGVSETGELQNILVHDRSDPDAPVSYIARTGRIAADSRGSYTLFEDGHILSTAPDGTIRRLSFATHRLPLRRAAESERGDIGLRANEYMIHQLFTAQTGDAARLQARGIQLVGRVADPLILVLLAFAATAGGGARTGYTSAVLATSFLAILYQTGLLALFGELAGRADASLLLFWPVLWAAGLCAHIASRGHLRVRGEDYGFTRA